MGMGNKSYGSQGQRSPNLHNNGRYVGFLGVSVTAIILQTGIPVFTQFFLLNCSFICEI